MSVSHRFIYKKIAADLRRKIVFPGGPRQVGKTTLAESLRRAEEKTGQLLNWDDEQDSAQILAEEFSSE